MQRIVPDDDETRPSAEFEGFDQCRVDLVPESSRIRAARRNGVTKSLDLASERVAAQVDPPVTERILAQLLALFD